MFGNCNHCCFCCGHPFTRLGVSLFISCKNKIQCVCVSCGKKGNKKNLLTSMNIRECSCSEEMNSIVLRVQRHDLSLKGYLN